MRKSEMLEEIEKNVRRMGYLPSLMRFPINERVVACAIFDVFIRSVENALLRGDEVGLKNLGKFHIVYRDPRRHRNNLTGESIDLEGRVKLKFIPSENFMRKLSKHLT